MKTLPLLLLLLLACEREPEPNYLKVTYCYELASAPDPVDKFGTVDHSELRLVSVIREKVFAVDPVDRQWTDGVYLYVVKYTGV